MTVMLIISMTRLGLPQGCRPNAGNKYGWLELEIGKWYNRLSDIYSDSSSYDEYIYPNFIQLVTIPVLLLFFASRRPSDTCTFYFSSLNVFMSSVLFSM